MEYLHNADREQLLRVIASFVEHVGIEGSSPLIQEAIAQQGVREGEEKDVAFTGGGAGSGAGEGAMVVVVEQGVGKKPKKSKEFDMSKYRQRNVAMQVQYEGGPYFGFASQAGECEETIEKHLFDALLKLRLIESRKTCSYSRCGRTDRGVSALGQVVAFSLRSNIPCNLDDELVPRHPGDGVMVTKPKQQHQATKKIKQAGGGRGGGGGGMSEVVVDDDANGGRKRKETEEEEEEEEKEAGKGKRMEQFTTENVKEIDYCVLMNRCLPEGIRVLGWCEVSPDFSSRFSAAYRTYRYFFVRNNLDVEAMHQAAQLLVGTHDFRNLCKIDMANVTNFRREIYSAQVVCFSENEKSPEESVWMLEIRGIAFLWHMVRCIMSILLLVGERGESPSVVSHLLDVETNAAKPHYSMAPEAPLVLHQCGFDHLNIHKLPKNLWALTTHFEQVWQRHTIAAARAKNSIQFLKSCLVRKCDLDELLEQFASSKKSDAGKKEALAGGKPDESDRKRCKVSSSSSSSSISSDELEEEDSSSIMIRWEEALRIVTSLHDAAVASSYVPLMQRQTGDLYEERVTQLRGTKKERLERHLQMQSEPIDANFFQKMRSQGTKE